MVVRSKPRTNGCTEKRGMPGYRKILIRFVQFPPFPMQVDGVNALAVIEFLPNP